MLSHRQKNLLEYLKGGLIVSCQSLPEEHLHGPDFMARMAKAALVGGARGIRANSPQDIQSIRQAVALPIIGLHKVEYSDSAVKITPTLREIQAVASTGAAVVAIDATQRPRPHGETLESLVKDARSATDALLMADVSTLEEGIKAARLGFDLVATTLSGYTPYSQQRSDPDFELIRQLARNVKIPVIAEGRIQSPAQAQEALLCGAWAVVVGSAITRPQFITHQFSQALDYVSKKKSGVYLALDIGGTKIAGGILEGNGRILLQKTIPTEASRGAGQVITNGLQLAQELIKDYRNESATELAAIGVGSAGQIHFETGTIVDATSVIPGWKGTNLKRAFESNLNLPVFVENDANAAAYGEYCAGAARGFRNVVCLTLGTGIGGGVIIDGQLLRGSTGAATELGHITLEIDGEPCPCGRTGCLEAYSSGSAMLRFAEKVLRQLPPGTKSELVNLDSSKLNANSIFEACSRRDTAAAQIVNRACRYLAKGLISLQLIFDTECFVLAGGLSNVGAPLLEGIRVHLLEKDQQLRIALASLGNQAGLIGAALLARDSL
jgi:N-acetylmannosamine-6-phosphate 2-epimerase / N-acetylmannosamine kinase